MAEWDNQFGEGIAIAAVCVMAATSVYGAYESKVQSDKAAEYQDKMDKQLAADRAQNMKDKAEAEKQAKLYAYITYAGLGISITSLMVFVYMVMRK